MSTADRAATAPPRAKADDVEDLLQLMQESESLWLWRRAGDKWVFLEKRPRDAFGEGVAESTRLRTGGGDYRARIRQANGQFREQRAFSVAGAELPVPGETSASSATAAAPAASSYGQLPEWVNKLVLPIVTALGAGLASKLFEKPSIDPLMLELLKRSTKGDGSIDPIELQRLVQDAEKRGEDRGREIGKLSSRGERTIVQRDSGVVDAIREVAPMVKDLVMSARETNEVRRRVAGPPSTSSDVVRLPAPPAAPPADIVPAWLRPFMPFKRMLLGAADNGTDAPAIVELIVKNADDATWAAMIEADQGDRLQSDLEAAIPELTQSEKRAAFVAELLEDLRHDLRAELATDDVAASESTDWQMGMTGSNNAKPKKSAKKGAAKKTAAQ